MKPNIESKGRVIRGVGGVVTLGIAVTSLPLGWPLWITIVLAIAGLFTLFEATVGWCAMRALGIKTKF